MLDLEETPKETMEETAQHAGSLELRRRGLKLPGTINLLLASL